MKFPNQDYKMVYRAGAFYDKHTLRREHEAGAIVFWCMAGVAMIILSVMLQSCAGSTGVIGGVHG